MLQTCATVPYTLENFNLEVESQWVETKVLYTPEGKRACNAITYGKSQRHAKTQQKHIVWEAKYNYYASTLDHAVVLYHRGL